MAFAWLEQFIDALARMAPEGSFLSLTFMVRALVAVVLVSVICGAVGSLVVGNRMAFFSDALAHCAFAGVALGLLLAVALRAPREGPFYDWYVPAIMATFGILVGTAIAFVRERTALASDTVIGVFFAGAIGFGAVFFKALSDNWRITPDQFLFGNPVFVGTSDLVLLFFLAILTLTFLMLLFNPLVFGSFNASLARSRNIPMRLCSYLFIALLALIVNLSIRSVGALLINAMLIVPAATAGNLCRNMRQHFWFTLALSLFSSVFGLYLSFKVAIPVRQGDPIRLGTGGSIVVLSVLLFFVSMAVGPSLQARKRKQTEPAPLAKNGVLPENARTPGELGPASPA